MSPAAFVEAASAWALAPGFRRARDGERPLPITVGGNETAGDVQEQQ